METLKVGSHEYKVNKVEFGSQYRLEIIRTAKTRLGFKFVHVSLHDTLADADETLEKVTESLNKYRSRKDEEKRQRKTRKQEMANEQVEKIQVGTILVNSWGREQTNIDAYQVIKKSGKKVMLRRICIKHSSECGNSMAENVKPCANEWRTNSKGEFEEFDKVIGAYGIVFDHGSCDIRDGEKEYYRSWYA